MNKQKAFSNLVAVVKNQVGALAFEKAQDSFGNIWGKEFRIPLGKFVSDKKVLQIMMEFELDKPENLVRFLMESFFGAFEVLQTEIAKLELMQINEPIGIIQSAKRRYDYSIENPDEKVSVLNEVQHDLFRAVGILERQVETCVSSIRSIDNVSKWKFFVNAKGYMQTINTDISLVRVSLDALEQAVSMHMLIAADLGRKIESSVLQPYEDFYQRVLLFEDNCRLLDAYEFENRKSEKYFLRLPEKKNNVRGLGTAYKEYVDELEGYDNIVF